MSDADETFEHLVHDPGGIPVAVAGERRIEHARIYLDPKDERAAARPFCMSRSPAGGDRDDEHRDHNARQQPTVVSTSDQVSPPRSRRRRHRLRFRAAVRRF